MSFVRKIKKDLKKPERELRRIRDQVKELFDDASEKEDQPQVDEELVIPVEISQNEMTTEDEDKEPKKYLEVDNNAINDFVAKLKNSEGWSRGEDNSIDCDSDVEGELSKSNREYSKIEADMMQYIEQEVLICDTPFPVPQPDFTGLERQEELDYDFPDYHIFDYLHGENMDTENINTTGDILMEKAVQEPGHTDDFYPTENKHRGLALLMINNSLLEEDENCLYKIQQLTALFSNILDFETERYDILHRQMAEDILKKVNDCEEENRHCLVVVILSLGHKDRRGREFIRFGKDTVETCNLWRCVDGNTCPKLAVIPKIFIQVAWPDWKEKTRNMTADSVSNERQDIGDIGVSFMVPEMSHFFIVSAIPQVADIFDEQMVNCFLDNMIDVLRIHCSDWDLNKIMTEVNARVCQTLQPNPRRINGGINPDARAPNFTSSLTKFFTFKSKSQ